MPRAKRKLPELKVVFDTNVLYTGAASDFLRQEVRDLIHANSGHEDLTVSWIVPEIVLHERQYQMRARGYELLPAIEKLERLLGHNLNITKQIVELRVREVIQTQLDELGIAVHAVDTVNVDWNRLMLDAAYRKPPFDRGEKEKGFRDALVAETFFQIVAQSPSTPKLCRVALVTNDALLTEAVVGRAATLSNVRVLATPEDLKGLINTLASEVSEEFVAGIREIASQYFFLVKRDDTLYYKEGIRGRVLSDFSDQLSQIPEGATQRENGRWTIYPPRFVRKAGQRVTWATRISVAASAYSPSFSRTGEMEGASTNPIIAAILGTIASQAVPSNDPQMQAPPNPYIALQSPKHTTSGRRVVARRNQVPVATGRSTFEVVWSVSVSTNRRLSSPKVEAISFVETIWE